MRQVFALLCLIAFASLALAYPNNPPNGYAGQPPSGSNCVNCHDSYPLNSGNGSLGIAGFPPAGYVAGTIYPLTVTLADPGQMRWGFETTAIYQSGTSYLQAGNFTVTDPTNTSLGVGSGTAPDYMKQTTTGTYAGTPGPTSWSFNWTAPAATTGLITFYMSGAACNNTGGTGGDYCYTATASVSPAGGNPNMLINLTYTSGSPVPPTGGPLAYTIVVTNNESASQPFQYWSTYSQGATVVPAFGPASRIAPPGPGYIITRYLTQMVPGSLGAGAWNYNGYVGMSPTVWASDFFPFTKSVSGDGGAYISEGTLLGWEEEEPGVVAATPKEFELLGNYPNPFNPTTVLRYELRTASLVRLQVYDMSGHLVSTLVNGWRDAGRQEVTFDGSSLASGIYVYRLQAGQLVASGKMVLMK